MCAEGGGEVGEGRSTYLGIVEMVGELVTNTGTKSSASISFLSNPSSAAFLRPTDIQALVCGI